jgi:ureidoacrylate peracid hydrolase
MNSRTVPTLEQKVHPSHAVVLVIDMQNDFCSEKGAVSQFQDRTAVHSMIPALRHFVGSLRKAAIATIFVKTVRDEGDLSDPMREVLTRNGRVGGRACLRGSWGAQFIEGFQPLPNENVIEKKEYSAFVGTDLDALLKNLHCHTLILTGVASNICVESTARDGFMMHYHVVLPSDLIAAYDDKLHATTLMNIDSHFGQVISSQDLLKAWEALKVIQTR